MPDGSTYSLSSTLSVPSDRIVALRPAIAEVERRAELVELGDHQLVGDHQRRRVLLRPRRAVLDRRDLGALARPVRCGDRRRRPGGREQGGFAARLHQVALPPRHHHDREGAARRVALESATPDRHIQQCATGTGSTAAARLAKRRGSRSHRGAPAASARRRRGWRQLAARAPGSAGTSTGRGAAAVVAPNRLAGEEADPPHRPVPDARRQHRAAVHSMKFVERGAT